MKILLTGGSGFIGSNFIAANGSKFDIVAPSSQQTDLMRVEQVQALFKQHKFDAVVHAADKTDGVTGSADNLIMFKNLQYAAILNGVKKLIVIGDAADMDLSTPVEHVKESGFGQTMPNDSYGLGRYLIHLLASKDKISTVLRFFTVFGAGADSGTNPIMSILARGVTGKKTVTVPDKLVSTIYIDDAVRVIAAFLTNDFAKGDYNVASPSPINLIEFAKKARSFAKKNGREITVEITGEQCELTADTEKLAAVLPNFRFTADNTAINKTLEKLNAKKSLCRPKKKEAKVEK